MTIRKKLILSVVITITLFIAMGGIFYFQLTNISQPLFSEIPQKIEEMGHVHKMSTTLLEIEYKHEQLNSYIYKYIHSGDMVWKRRYYSLQSDMKNDMNDLISQSRSEDEKNKFKEIRAVIDKMYYSDQNVLALVNVKRAADAIDLFSSNDREELDIQLEKKIEKVYKENGLSVIHQNEKSTVAAQIAAKKGKKIIESQLVFTVIFVLVCIVFLSVSSYFGIRSITRTVNLFKDNIRQISQGNVKNIALIDSHDEIGALFTEFEELQKSLEVMTENIDSIAAGNVNVSFLPRGEDDQLSMALNKMTGALTRYKENTDTLINYLNKIPSPVIAVNREYAILYANPCAGQLFSKHYKDLQGKNVYSVLSMESHDPLRLGKLFSYGTVQSGEVIIEGDGDEIPYNYIAEPIRDENSDVSKALVFWVDVSDLKDRVFEIEKQIWLRDGMATLNNLIRDEKNIEVLCDNICLFIAEYLESQVVALYTVESDTSCTLTGSFAYQPNCKEMKIQGYITETLKQQSICTITDVSKDYFTISSSLGSMVPTYITIVPFVYNEVTHAFLEIGSIAELSDEKKQFLDNLIEALGISFYTLKNQKMLEALLLETQKQAQELQKQQVLLQERNDTLADRTSELQASEELLKDQQAELKATNEELEDKTNYLQKQKDEIERSNRELSEAREELEKKANALEESSRYKSEFLANMSHELRTPLNSMLILSKNLAKNKQKNLTEKQVRHAQTVFKAGNDLLELVNDILDLSKVEAGKMEAHFTEVPVGEIIKECEQTFRPLTEEKGIKFTINCDSDVPEYVITDQQKINQILKNFLSNAVKFTSEGSVTLHLHLGKNDGKHIVFDVIDTGIGIEAEKLNTIFDAFQQADGSTSRKYGGTGLGLSISKEFVQLLEGTLDVHSEFGKGSTFTAIIPITPKGVESQGKSVSLISKDKNVTAVTSNLELLDVNRRISDKEGTTVLIIEDDKEFAEILCELIKEKGAECIHAYDGVEGIKLCQDYLPDAILLDLNLPKKSGIEVLENIKQNENTRHIPVHIMSAQNVGKEIFEKGALGFLSKPISEEELDKAFMRIGKAIAHTIKELMVVTTNELLMEKVNAMFNADMVNITHLGGGKDALKIINVKTFDCIIIDLQMSDITGIELIEEVKICKNNHETPIIIYTEQNLRKDEKEYLNEHINSVVMKSANFEERLLDEVTLFMHTFRDDIIAKRRRELSNGEGYKGLKGKSVLIVDDDVRNIYALSEELEDVGMRVIKAFNGKEALSSLEEEVPDIVLMDIMMPEMNGYETMDNIRKNLHSERLPIIALTAKAMKEDKEKCYACGANEYLSKPIDIDKLLSCITVWTK